MSFTLLHRARWSLAIVVVLASAAQAQCPAPLATALVERFISADCEACWRDGSALADDAFTLDWIAPSPHGDAAPLAAAALAEAAARAGTLPPAGRLERRWALPPQSALRLRVDDGPAWFGYIALQLRVEGDALPAGAVGYLALVENVAAGDEGTLIARRLVRALAGPLPLSAGVDHLRAVRVPAGAKAERLSAVGWVEASAGQPIALAAATRGDCAAKE